MAKVPEVLGEGGLPNFRDTYLHPQNGQKYPCYRFPKREACLMAMSYSYELQAAVYDRMTALEEQGRGPKLPNFHDPVIAARAWADQAEAARKAESLALAATTRAVALEAQALQLESKTQQLEQQIEEDRPKVAFTEAIIAAKESILICDLAKLLKQNNIADVGQNRLFQYLRRHGYLHNRGSRRNQPTQKSVEAGLMVLKEGTRTGSNGEMHVTLTPKITGKGQEYFINHFLQKRRGKLDAAQGTGHDGGQSFDQDFMQDNGYVGTGEESPGREKMH
jgi:phage antirepressor YoqD-like protein